MSTGNRIPLADARAIANDVISQLRPHCSKREVAGSILRTIAPWRTIRRLEATVQRLEKVISNPMVSGIEIGRETGITAGMRGSGPEMLAGMFVGLMEEHGKDAPNYLELSFATPKGKILVTVTQPNGATPHQLRAQAEQRAKELEAELAELRAGMEAPEDRDQIHPPAA